MFYKKGKIGLDSLGFVAYS